MDNHMIYAASVRQMNGLIAERNALFAALTAAHEQVAGLLAERELLRAESDELRTQLTIARTTIFEVSSVRDDALDDDEPDHFEDCGGSR